MGLPDTTPLDLAWLGSGPFCRPEPKAFSSGSLDYAWIGSGPLVAFYGGDELSAAALGVTVAFGQAEFEIGLHASALGVAVAFGSAELTNGVELEASSLSVSVAFGQAALEPQLNAAGLGVGVAFGSAALGDDLAASALGVSVAFGTAWVGELGLLHAAGLGPSVEFGAAALRELRREAPGDPTPLLAREPLVLLSASGAVLAHLTLARRVRIRQELNGLDVLSFDFPPAAEDFDLLGVGCFIRFRGQEYRVVGVDDARELGGLSASVTAEQYFVNLGDTLVRELALEEVSAAEAMAAALAGSGWTVGGVGPSGSYGFTASWATPLAILVKVAELWNGELEFDSAAQIVHLHTERGADLGASLVFRKNLQGIRRKVDASKLYNRI